MDQIELMTPHEVAEAFRVDPKTVTRWAKQGKIRSIRTPGGHRRYVAADVRAHLEGPPKPRDPEE
jgi:excisionase family DNA binding protein